MSLAMVTPVQDPYTHSITNDIDHARFDIASLNDNVKQITYFTREGQECLMTPSDFLNYLATPDDEFQRQ
jgi:hypothetical protein